ncbi:ser/thr protein phosphatase [Purpureocillium lavendulum]|uniref:Ser/thr protein phosphatase n=1 Tax=Purpureocillium lavendulum TaxID=1247861 RepID=A0AB34FIN7_9HYPO|nr:ser/thr protein phosphatase [Purpureocillium lavendulum]
METVLSANKDAIARKGSILACSCSTKSPVQLLPPSICGNPIAWSDAMISADPDQAADPFPSACALPAGSPAHIPKVRVLPQPITIGQHQIGKLGRALHAQVMAGELRVLEVSMTESGEQQAYATYTSQRVWNSAYDSLKNDGNTATLVESYVRTLNKALGTENDTGNGVAAVLDDSDTRQHVMKKFVKAGQAKIATSSRLTKGVGSVAEFIHKIKPIADTAIGNLPQAALPWVGILLNPAKVTNSNLAGITHVVSRMEWYCALTVHLLEDDGVKIGDETHMAVLRQLEENVLALYKALLLYQMKASVAITDTRAMFSFEPLRIWTTGMPT